MKKTDANFSLIRHFKVQQMNTKERVFSKCEHDNFIISLLITSDSRFLNTIHYITVCGNNFHNKSLFGFRLLNVTFFYFEVESPFSVSSDFFFSSNSSPCIYSQNLAAGLAFFGVFFSVIQKQKMVNYMV